MQVEERPYLQIATRVPAEIGDKLTAMAEAERRSMSMLLAILVEEALTAREAE